LAALQLTVHLHTFPQNAEASKNPKRNFVRLSWGKWRWWAGGLGFRGPKFRISHSVWVGESVPVSHQAGEMKYARLLRTN